MIDTNGHGRAALLLLIELLAALRRTGALTPDDVRTIFDQALRTTQKGRDEAIPSEAKTMQHAEACISAMAKAVQGRE